jgi:hypothetical protein
VTGPDQQPVYDQTVTVMAIVIRTRIAHVHRADPAGGLALRRSLADR